MLLPLAPLIVYLVSVTGTVLVNKLLPLVGNEEQWRAEELLL